MARALLLVWFTFSMLSVRGQSYGDSRYKQAFNKADAHLYNGSYLQAMPLVEELHALDSSIANLNYMLGLCHLNGSKNYDKAIYYLEKASKDVSKDFRETDWKERKAPGITYLYLGRAYHYLNQFERAVSNYYNYRSFIDVADIETYNKVRMVIKHAENAMELVQTPVKASMINLGPTINSSYPEYTPVISADGQSLIFTARRPGGSRDVKDKDGLYFEDIYVSVRQATGIWGRPQLLGGGITSSGHQAAIGVSPDGQTLFIYKDDNGNGEIYQSELKDNVWTVPVKMGSDINTTSWETHATVSPDGELLIFTSNRPGGFGGRDLWYCNRLPDGSWGLAQNMGGVINTQYDEESPFLGFDGGTLFFSSQGHTSMGGFDIFRSELENGTWQEVKNLGFPINTSEDDIFFVLAADGRTAYLSSRREGGYGDTDIYSLQIEQRQTESKAVIQGDIRVPNNDFVRLKPTVTVKDIAGKEIGAYRPNPNTGRFVLIVNPVESYNLTFAAEGFPDFNRMASVGREMAYENLGGAFTIDAVIFGEDVQRDMKQEVKDPQVSVAATESDSVPAAVADEASKMEQARLKKEAELEAARLDSILADVFLKETEAARLEDEAEARREAEAKARSEAEAEARRDAEAKARSEAEARRDAEAKARSEAEAAAAKKKEMEKQAERERLEKEAAAKFAAEEAARAADRRAAQVVDAEVKEVSSTEESEPEQSVSSDSVMNVSQSVAEVKDEAGTQLEALNATEGAAVNETVNNKEASEVSVAKTEEELKREALLKRLEELRKKKKELEEGVVQESSTASVEKEKMARQEEEAKARAVAEARAKAEEESLKAEAALAAQQQEEARQQEEANARAAAEARAKAEEERLKAEAALAGGPSAGGGEGPCGS